MKFLLPLLLLLTLSGAMAQIPLEYEIVDLSITRKLGNYPFYIDKIVDNRPNKGCLDVRTDGYITFRRLLKFEEGFMVHLREEIDDLLWPNDKKQALTMQINKLWYDEFFDDESELHYHAMVKFELILEKDDKQLSYGEFIGTDTNTLHHVLPGTMFRDAFEDAFKPLKKKYWNSLEPQAREFKPSVPRTLKPFDYNQQLPVGFYRNFKDLIEHRVNDSLECMKSPHGSKGGPEKWDFLIKNSGVQARKNLFYFDGKDLYTQFSGNYFIQSHYIGKFIYFEDVYVINESTANVSEAAIVGAISPVLGLGLALSQRDYRGMVINSETGTRIPLIPVTIFQLLEPYPDLFSQYESDPGNLEVVKELIMELNRRYELENTN